MLRSLRMSALLALCTLAGCAHHKNPGPSPGQLTPPLVVGGASGSTDSPPGTPIPETDPVTPPPALRAPVAGMIRGTVSDSTGAAVPGAVVTATGAGGAKQTKSDQSGQFSIGGLVPGTYSVSVQRSGFASRMVDGVSVGAGEASAVNVALPVGMETTTMLITPGSHRAGREGAAAPESFEDQVESWFQGLKDGSIDYQVPVNMILNQSYTATATIHPRGTAPGSTPEGAHGGAATPPVAVGAHGPVEVTHALPVSMWMRVELSAPGNVDAFQIQQDPLPCKFVGKDADAQWTFTVKPVQSGKGKTLTFNTYAVYGNDASACLPSNPTLHRLQVPADTVKVNVGDVDLHEITRSAWDKFWTEPWNYVKYVLPGGAGFAAIGKLIAWIRKKGDEEDGAPSPPQEHAGG